MYKVWGLDLGLRGNQIATSLLVITEHQQENEMETWLARDHRD